VIALVVCLVAASALLLSSAASVPSTPPAGNSLAGAPETAVSLPSRAPMVLPLRRERTRKTGIGLFTAIPAALPASGGKVRLLADVQRATTCRFSSARTLARLPSRNGCKSGTTSFDVKLPRNRTPSAQTYRFRLTAAGSHGTAKAGPVTVVVESPLSRSLAAPAITTQPTSQSAVSGTSATLVAAASGLPTPSVQWQVSTDGGADWANVAGATSTSYSLAAITSENGYEYRAAFANLAGSATTHAATLTVPAPTTLPPAATATSVVPAPSVAPAITTQPTNQRAVSGGSATFTANASGDPTPSVQWQVSTNGGGSWANVPGATSTSYTFTTTTGQSGYQYQALFTNTADTATTNTATLAVSTPNATPAITAQPTNQSAVSGGSATFTADASGNPTPSVQWQVSTNGGGSWGNVPGAISASYTLTTTTSQSGYQYQALFTNTAGTATTTTATLTVSTPNAAPAITAQPTDQTIYSGGRATFTADASGNPTPSVQWQVSTNGGGSWGNVSGATSTTFWFYANIGATGWEYRATFTDVAGSATTAAAALTVLADGPTSTDWSGYVATGSSFSAVSGSWTVPAVSCSAGATTYSFEWIGIDGETNNTVEQDGTAADCSAGSPTYFAWYEMYGDAGVNDGMWVALPYYDPVSAGDEMSASVSVARSTWQLTIQDQTQGWTSSTPIASPSPAPAQSSAEWIVELPGGAPGSDNTLSDFGTVSFTGASADGNAVTGPISAFSPTSIGLVNGSTVLAAPGPLNESGDGFTDAYTG
jgi:hypothetical protein